MEDSVESTLRDETCMKSWEMSDVGKDASREISGNNGMDGDGLLVESIGEGDREDVSNFASSTSIETPTGTPTGTPKVSPVKQVANKVLSTFGLKKPPIKMEFADMSLVKSTVKGRVNVWEALEQREPNGDFLKKRQTRGSLS